MKIVFDLEASDQEAAFFALYAGLRMYQEAKDNVAKPGMFFIAAAEAYCLRKDLKQQYPELYAAAEKEYEEVYVKPREKRIAAAKRKTA